MMTRSAKPAIVALAWAATGIFLSDSQAQNSGANPNGGARPPGLLSRLISGSGPRQISSPEPSPVVSPLPPGEDGTTRPGGGLIGRLRERRAAAIPMQQGTIADATGYDRKSVPAKAPSLPASVEKPQPSAAKTAKKPNQPVSVNSETPARPGALAWEDETGPPLTTRRRFAEPMPVKVGATTSTGTHYVTIRDGVEASVATPDGREGVLRAGTVLRFLGRDGDRVRVRSANGVEMPVAVWQVRDATFEEAVTFLQAEG